MFMYDHILNLDYIMQKGKQSTQELTERILKCKFIGSSKS